jgi:hypothetical protein
MQAVVVTALNPASQWRSTAIAAALRQFIDAAGFWKKGPPGIATP